VNAVLEFEHRDCAGRIPGEELGALVLAGGTSTVTNSTAWVSPFSAIAMRMRAGLGKPL
jgi:hypothetical protein